MTKIYVTRHGQSMTNIDLDMKRREQGHKVTLNTINNILTEQGIEEAMDYARKLKSDDVTIDHIICSPLGRTKQTGFTIASVLATLVPITYNKHFREIEWDVGGKFDRLENHIPGFDSKNLAVHETPIIDTRRGVQTLESQQNVYDRVVAELRRVALKAQKKNETTLIVTHFFPVRSILSLMEAGDSSRMLNHSPKNLCMLSWDVEEIIEKTA